MINQSYAILQNSTLNDVPITRHRNKGILIIHVSGLKTSEQETVALLQYIADDDGMLR